MTSYKGIQLKDETYNRLVDRKYSKGESFESVIIKLLNKYEGLM